MKEFNLKGTARTAGGKKAAKQLRATGAIPCNLYGVQKDAEGKAVATSFAVDFEAVRKLIYTPDIFTVNLDIDGATCKCVMREIQFHPVKDNVLHVDFLEVHAEKPIVMGVPIAPEGLAEGVRAGGRLMCMVRKINVKALYSAIPEKLIIDVTKLQLGKSIKVGDLQFEGLELVTPKEVIVCTVKMTRAAMGAAAAAAKA